MIWRLWYAGKILPQDVAKKCTFAKEMMKFSHVVTCCLETKTFSVSFDRHKCIYKPIGNNIIWMSKNTSPNCAIAKMRFSKNQHQRLTMSEILPSNIVAIVFILFTYFMITEINSIIV